MSAVPEADVIVTNPTHISIAIKYDTENFAAPLVVAKGVDEKEKQEEEELTELKSELEQAEKEKYASSKKKSELREKSKQILNSLYGI